MKKVFKIVIITSLLMSLVACGSNEETNEITKDTSAVINVYTRDSSSGTREAFENAIGLEDGALTIGVSEVSSNGDMATKVGIDESSIGYTSLTTDFDANNIKPLKFEGVNAGVETVLDGTYKMQRPFNYVTRLDNDFENEDIKELVRAFIDFITKSQEGLSALEEAGAIVDYGDAIAWEEIAKNYDVLNKDNSHLTIRTGGSTSVEKCIKAALEAFQPLAGNVAFAMNQTGSGDAIKRTIGEEKDGANRVEIGFTSRKFKDDEDVSDAMISGTFCKDAVVVVVNSSNSIEDISAKELNDIYSGKVTSFKDLN